MNCGAGLLMAGSLCRRRHAPPPSYMILIILTSLAVHICGINRIAAECEPDNMITDVVWPCRGQAREPPPFVREQRARRLFKARQVSRHRRHEMIRRIARGAAAVLVAIGAARRFDQFS